VKPRAAITGLGAVTGFGRGAERLWSALVAGRRAVRERPELIAAGLAPGSVALVEELPWSAPSRVVQMASWAAREALADADAPPPGPRMGVACGTTLGGIASWLSVVRADEEARARAGGAGADRPVAAPARWTYAGPAQAVAAEMVLAGGADALQDFVIQGFGCLKALDPAPCRPFDRSRKGLNLGEAAGFVVVEAEAHARARGARIRGFLDGYGIAADAVHMTGPDKEGRGAARAMRAALEDAGRREEEIGFVSAHGTATVFNDLMEAQALTLVFGGERVGRIAVNSIKSALGHTLGAAAALEAIACVRTVETGMVPPTAGLEEVDPAIGLDVVHGAARKVEARVVLSTASGFGGTNAAVVVGAA
jgi:3-oxoacyl-[acyl-carrier-protein] synthase II